MSANAACQGRSLRDIPLIAIVDDNEAVRVSVECLVRSLGYRACAFPSAEEFLGSAAPAMADCIIADVRMPGMDGMELLRRMRAAEGAPPVILVTAFADEALRRRAHADGAHCLLDKPFDECTMVECLRQVLDAKA
jgi:FixJ family two-component response regulator